MENAKTIYFEGSPYFIRETESGIFHLIRSIDLERAESGEVWKNQDFDENKLEEGLDLREVSTRGINLMVKGPRSEHILPYAVAELKKLAQVSGHDYFSFECFGESISEYSINIGGHIIRSIKPRLFRKIVND